MSRLKAAPEGGWSEDLLLVQFSSSASLGSGGQRKLNDRKQLSPEFPYSYLHSQSPLGWWRGST